MRYIDAEKLICDIDGSKCLDTERDYEEVARRIDECETADVEEVIRCKDCKFRFSETCFSKHETSDMDFCSVAQRKS